MTSSHEKVSLREALRLHGRAFRDVRAYSAKALLVIALHAAAQALSPYATVVLSAQILDELAGGRRPEVLWPLVGLTVGSTALLAFLTGALQRQKEAAAGAYAAQKEQLFCKKLLSMDFADVDRPEVHDLLSQIRQNEIWDGWGFPQLLEQFANLVQSALGILGAITLTVTLFTLPVPQTAGTLTALNQPVFLVALVAVLGGIAYLGPACRNRAITHWTAKANEAKFANRLFSAFGPLGSRLERAMDIRMYKQQRIARAYTEQNRIFGVKGSFARCARGPMGAWAALSAGFGALLTGAIYVFVCLKAWAGAFGVGSVAQYVGALAKLMENLSLLLETVGRLKSNTPFLRTAYELLDIPNEMYSGSLTTEKRSDRQYAIEFRDVSFRYPGTNAWALRHVSLRFRIGSRLAVVGENGSGKTTFIKLLCRLYDPQEGQILLNGIDIRKYNPEEYRALFAVVFQDYQLLSLPLGENVAGAKNYDRPRAEKALRDAGLADRLRGMPKGLDTPLYREFEKDGVEVSGGEAQKIAIARTLYKDAPFLILDEPTAALDPVAEAEIYAKFNAIAGDKTAISISHRLSSCKFCDEIAVFHRGEVIQKGTHEELLADPDGKYHVLWHAQAQYYAEQERNASA